MARKQPKYVSLEPKAFLADFEFQAMTAEERGVYVTIIFSLYANNGRLKYDEKALRKLCNVKSEFDFQTVFRKFKIRRGFIRHKRVTQELQKAQILVDRAVKAANARWDTGSTSNAQASAKQCQGKLSKGKLSNIKNPLYIPPQKKKYLDHVLLTDEEHTKLIERFGANDTRVWIEKLDSYIGSKGKKYKSHYKTIINWSLDNGKKSRSTANRRNPGQNEPYIR